MQRDAAGAVLLTPAYNFQFPHRDPSENRLINYPVPTAGLGCRLLLVGVGGGGGTLAIDQECGDEEVHAACRHFVATAGAGGGVLWIGTRVSFLYLNCFLKCVGNGCCATSFTQYVPLCRRNSWCAQILEGCVLNCNVRAWVLLERCLAWDYYVSRGASFRDKPYEESAKCVQNASWYMIRAVTVRTQVNTLCASGQKVPANGHSK